MVVGIFQVTHVQSQQIPTGSSVDEKIPTNSIIFNYWGGVTPPHTPPVGTPLDATHILLLHSSIVIEKRTLADSTRQTMLSLTKVFFSLVFLEFEGLASVIYILRMY